MIIVAEPQCVGFEHVEVNTALLTVIRQAFPTKEIWFFAEKEHLNLVKEMALFHSCAHMYYRTEKAFVRVW